MRSRLRSLCVSRNTLFGSKIARGKPLDLGGGSERTASRRSRLTRTTKDQLQSLSPRGYRTPVGREPRPGGVQNTTLCGSRPITRLGGSAERRGPDRRGDRTPHRRSGRALLPGGRSRPGSCRYHLGRLEALFSSQRAVHASPLMPWISRAGRLFALVAVEVDLPARIGVTERTVIETGAVVPMASRLLPPHSRSPGPGSGAMVQVRMIAVSSAV
jgi:hypothetical protein